MNRRERAELSATLVDIRTALEHFDNGKGHLTTDGFTYRIGCYCVDIEAVIKGDQQ